MLTWVHAHWRLLSRFLVWSLVSGEMLTWVHAHWRLLSRFLITHFKFYMWSKWCKKAARMISLWVVENSSLSCLLLWRSPHFCSRSFFFSFFVCSFCFVFNTFLARLITFWWLLYWNFYDGSSEPEITTHLFYYCMYMHTTMILCRTENQGILSSLCLYTLSLSQCTSPPPPPPPPVHYYLIRPKTCDV